MFFFFIFHYYCSAPRLHSSIHWKIGDPKWESLPKAGKCQIVIHAVENDVSFNQFVQRWQSAQRQYQLIFEWKLERSFHGNQEISFYSICTAGRKCSEQNFCKDSVRWSLSTGKILNCTLCKDIPILLWFHEFYFFNTGLEWNWISLNLYYFN